MGKRGITPGQGGHKQDNIDQQEFESLCEFQCTLEEIAAWFRCSDTTIQRWCNRVYGSKFEDIAAEKRQAGKVSLRRAQYQVALKGNTTMLIWLGKQYLKQSDKSESKEAVHLTVDDVKHLSDAELELIASKALKE